MIRFTTRRARAFSLHARVAMIAVALTAPTRAGDIPSAGDAAPDFTLKSLSGDDVRLSEATAAGPVVLVVLRGYPGYQCPVCSAQVADLAGKAGALRDAGARVILVYPGPAEKLRDRADEFLKGKPLPDGFTLALDPDYAFTSAYGLRWDAPQETAYPSTFVIGPDGKVAYALVSKTHGGRAKSAEVLEALGKLR